MSEDESIISVFKDLGNGKVRICPNSKSAYEVYYGDARSASNRTYSTYGDGNTLGDDGITLGGDGNTFPLSTTPPTPPPYVSGGQATTFSLIFNEADFLECQPRRQASVNSIATDVNSMEALAQSWEIIYLPTLGAYQLRNGDETFLGVYPNNVVGDLSGEPTAFNKWVFEPHIIGTSVKYRIQNLHLSTYLFINANRHIELVANSSNATLWDFQISGTVPP